MKPYTKFRLMMMFGTKWNSLMEFIIELCQKLTIKYSGPTFPVKPNGQTYTWEQICHIHKEMRNERRSSR